MRRQYPHGDVREYENPPFRPTNENEARGFLIRARTELKLRRQTIGLLLYAVRILLREAKVNRTKYC